VRETVRETGYSHRRFVAVFQRAVGLTPKRYCRVLRFRRVLERFAACPATPLTDLAQFGDYSDQAHFSREFREFAGITPGEYRRLLPPWPHHVPVAPR
jgi:AraC-like DNA-binding protein